jgi:GT2 family glycosyltransferase
MTRSRTESSPGLAGRAHLSVVIPTLGRPQLLARVLDRLAYQSAPADSFEVIVAADAYEQRIAHVGQSLSDRPYATRLLQADSPGASAARNAGWRAASTPLVLFLDDDILPESGLVAEHLAWHHRHPEPEVGVLGRVRWARELRVTPFMRWLEHGIQFDYPSIASHEASWGHFYTANASVKRELIERVGGFEERVLPFGYEDLDLALRMHRQQRFRLLYNRAAVAEHLHAMDLAFWKRRVARIAVSERQFVALHPEFRPYFYEKFSAATRRAPVHPLGARVAGRVPRWVPALGPWMWSRLDVFFRQALARPFLEAWTAAESGVQEASEPAGLAHPSGSSPGGPK